MTSIFTYITSGKNLVPYQINIFHLVVIFMNPHVSLDLHCIYHYCKDKAVANIKGARQLYATCRGGGRELNNQEVLLALFLFCFIW